MSKRPRARNLTSMLCDSVQAHPSATALLNPTATGGYDAWTYAELWRDIRRVALRLEQMGVKPGDNVGLLAESRAWWPITDFAVMGLQAVVVPIYPSLTATQVAYIVNQSQMSGIFLQDAQQLEKLVELAPAALPRLKFVVLYEDRAETAQTSAVIEEANKRWQVESFEAWRTAREMFSEEEWERRFAPLSEDHLATIVYTSGTTGNPKGTMLTHGNLLSNLDGIREVVNVSPSDRSMSYLPLSHIFERTAGQFFPLSAGAAIAYSRGMKYIAEDFKRMPPTLFTTIPRLLEKVQEQVMLRAEQTRGGKWLLQRALACGTAARVEGKPTAKWRLAVYDRLVFKKIREATGGRVRMVVSGGAPLPAYVGRFFAAAGIPVIEGYGMTETSPVIAVNPPQAPRFGTAGKVLSNVEVQIAEDGELLVRGPSISRGYYDDPVATAEAFSEDGWLHTGDIGNISEDGYLSITDRKKSLIILSTGKKVVPAAVETEILKDPLIDQVLLVGQNQKYVSAIVVPNEEMAQEWREAAAGIESGGSEGTNPNVVSTGPLADFFLKRVGAATVNLARFEQPKKVLIVREPFSVENGLLTPTLKVRARDVSNRYAAQIALLYAE